MVKRICNVRLDDRTSAEELRTRLKYEEHEGMFTRQKKTGKEWKRFLCLVNVETLSLVVVSPVEDIENLQ